MSEPKFSKDDLFMLLVSQLSSSAWIQLGKLPDPVSGKPARNLEAASLTIDILDALADKSKGNLEQDSEKSLASTLSQLKLNYLDELKKPAPPKEESPEKAASEANAPKANAPDQPDAGKE